MFELSIQAEFSAAHAIRIKGRPEPLHGHNWRITAVVAGERLDADGLLIDFHVVERALKILAAALDNRTLNDLPPFSAGLNPTAENVAKHLADSLSTHLPTTAPLLSLTVTEAPGCAATYRPSSP